MSNINYKNINLKYLRNQLGISQGSLAKKLNIDQSTLAKWENNTRQITMEWALKISSFFNIDIGNFINTDLKKNNTQNEIENIKKNYKFIIK